MVRKCRRRSEEEIPVFWGSGLGNRGGGTREEGF